MSLNKQILFNTISKQVKNPELLWLTKIIIFNNPTDNFVVKGDKILFKKIPPYKSLFHVPKTQGLPIGNLTSQFFANVYLNELDQFVKHKLKAKYYLRYVDDFLFLSRDKNQLKEWRTETLKFLKEHLELEINLQKQVLQNTNKGINWLGYIVKPDYILVRRRIVKNLKRNLFLFNQALGKYPKDKVTPELIGKMLSAVNSYFGFLKHADTFKLRKRLWDNHFKELRKYLEPKNKHLTSFQIRP